MLKFFLIYSPKQAVGHLDYRASSVSFAEVCKDVPSMAMALCFVNTFDGGAFWEVTCTRQLRGQC